MTRDVRDVSRSRRRSQALTISSTIPAISVLQQLDYLEYIDLYHRACRMRRPSRMLEIARPRPARQGVYGGCSSRGSIGPDASARLGDGQVNFKAIFSKPHPIRLSRLGGARVGMLSQHPSDGAAEWAKFPSPTTSSVLPTRLRRFRRRRPLTWRPIAACSASPDRGSRAMVDALLPDARTLRPLRLGMVGGGRGAFIGAVHRHCAPVWTAVRAGRGALSDRTPSAPGTQGGISVSRPGPSVPTFAEMAARRSRTGRRHRGRQHRHAPNDSHHAVARAFLDRGIDVSVTSR